MATPEGNIVQLEFFHAGNPDTDSLEEFQDGLELALAGVKPRANIKTVVRFYDHNGAMSRFVASVERLRRTQALYYLRAAAGAGGFLNNFLSKRNARKRIRAQERALDIARHHFAQAMRHWQIYGASLAIEQYDHRFRPIRGAELSEALEAVDRSHGVWIFIFKHNDLYADTNKLIAHTM